MAFLPRARVLTLEELAALGRAFVELGTRKIRITGGEPLVRCNVSCGCSGNWAGCGSVGLAELVLTTNGSQLERIGGGSQGRRRGAAQHQPGQPGAGALSAGSPGPASWTGCCAASGRPKSAGFERIKLNAVILKHRNHDEVVDLARFAIDQRAWTSASSRRCRWVSSAITTARKCSLLQRRHSRRSGAGVRADPDHREHRRSVPLLPHVPGTDSRIGFISPHSHNFCDDCNRSSSLGGGPVCCSVWDRSIRPI
jgi:cyclic pyranopterin phosphate synthase